MNLIEFSEASINYFSQASDKRLKSAQKMRAHFWTPPYVISTRVFFSLNLYNLSTFKTVALVNFFTFSEWRILVSARVTRRSHLVSVDFLQSIVTKEFFSFSYHPRVILRVLLQQHHKKTVSIWSKLYAVVLLLFSSCLFVLLRLHRLISENNTFLNVSTKAG